jgi:DNA-binding FadR family transcriptional regulator
MARNLPRSATLAHQVLGAIVRGDIPPGDPIDLPALGRANGVSRTVVREALADLGGKGLVRARPRVGTTVAPQDSWHLLDPELMAAVAAGPGCDALRGEAAALRRVIEPALAAEAAREAHRSQRSAVLSAVRQLAGAVGAADADAFAEADARLHGAIAAACTNRLLQAIDRALVPIRTLHRERLLAAAAADPGVGGARLRRTLALQTGLALAIVRGERVAASNWAVELAGLAATDDASGPTFAPVVPMREVAGGPGPTAWVRPAATVPSLGQRRSAAVPSPRVPQVAAMPPPADDWPDTNAPVIDWPDTVAPDLGPLQPAMRGWLDLLRHDDLALAESAPGRVGSRGPIPPADR